MGGLTRATRGQVLIEGLDASRMSARDTAQRLAFVTQHAPDTHGFSALEVVLTGRYPHLGRLEIEGECDRTIALQAMETTSVGEFAGRLTSSLSGGERQRVFLARGLAQEPRILLLDEPTASLDIRHQIAVLELARQVAAEGRAVVAAIHDLPMAARYCDRLVLLKGGHVIADGIPAEVLTPRNLAEAFGVHAMVFQNPVSGRLAIEFDALPKADASECASRPDNPTDITLEVIV
jgi:iron complex transport system ATP-binding protein